MGNLIGFPPNIRHSKSELSKRFLHCDMRSLNSLRGTLEVASASTKDLQSVSKQMLCNPFDVPI